MYVHGYYNRENWRQFRLLPKSSLIDQYKILSLNNKQKINYFAFQKGYVQVQSNNIFSYLILLEAIGGQKCIFLNLWGAKMLGIFWAKFKESKIIFFASLNNFLLSTRDIKG